MTVLEKGEGSEPWGARSGGERSEPERSGAQGVVRAASGLGPVFSPDPEVAEKAVRRRFTAGYKLRILKEADVCRDRRGAIGEMLRREGLYSSHLTAWRRQGEEGTLRALSPKKRGRKTKRIDPSVRRVKELERENRRLRKRLEQAETIIEIQKKVAKLLGESPNSPGSDETD